MTDQGVPGRFIQGEERWASFPGHAYRMRYLYLKSARPSGHPPVVFVHGFLGYSFSWRFNLEEFARTRDVYAIDLLGMGFSDRPPRGSVSFTMEHSGQRILDWLRGIELKNVDLVATSHGGAVAMMAAILDSTRNPPRENAEKLIGRLILVAPANPYSVRGKKRIRFFNTRLGAALLKLFGGVRLIKDLSLDFMYADKSRITPETRAGYQLMVDEPTTFDYALAVIKTWWEDMGAIEKSCASIADLPTLLVWGDRDRTVPTKTAGPLLSKFRKENSKLVILPGCGHMPYEEDPENFNRILLAWLDHAEGNNAGARA